MQVVIDSEARTATLTTEHPASSYGVPVLLLDTGEALGTMDARLSGLRVVEATTDEIKALQEAGYGG